MFALPQFLSRLLPEEDAATRDFKAREQRVVWEQLRRGKLSDALRAGAGRDKLFVAPAAAEPPGAAAVAPFPHTPLAAAALALEGLAAPAPARGGAAALFGAGGAAATVVTLAFQGSGQQMLLPWHEALRASPFGLRPAEGWVREGEGAVGGAVDAAAANAAAAAAVAAAAAAPLASPSPHPVRLLNVVYLQGWVFRLFAGALVASTRGALAADVAACSAVSFEPSQQAMDHFCERAGVHNRMMGHVMLVDRAGRVRWRAHGPPAPGEADNMLRALQGLVAAEARGGAAGARAAR